jgi:glycosyltransferase involved in cell wall biosynthesis
MKILYDHQTFTQQDYGGISRYFYELIKLGKADNENELELCLKFSNNSYIQNYDISSHIPFLNKTEFRGKRRLQNLLNQYNSSSYISKNNFDILHPTYYDTYFLKNIKNKKFTVTFLDMIHEKFASKYPELGNNKKIFNQKKELIYKAPKVIAISESTRNDLVEIYGVDANKIDVIYLGSSFNANSESNQPILSKPYILFVGSRSGYKNFSFCVEALHENLKNNDISFVCAGGGGFNHDEIDLINHLGLNDLVIQYSITDQILANLYKYSIAFVFPSLYEGFGIPVLEAFACNTPCLLSNGGSLPEVGGEAAVYFDPLNADSINNSINLILDDKNLRNGLINSGNQRLNKFSWKNTYDKTIKFYNTLS